MAQLIVGYLDIYLLTLPDAAVNFNPDLILDLIQVGEKSMDSLDLGKI